MFHRLRQREHLDTDIHGTGRCEEARRAVAVEADLTVALVVHHKNVVLPREGHDIGKEGVAIVDNGASRIVGVVDEEQLGTGEHVGGDRVEVGLEPILGQYWQCVGHSVD